MSEVKGKTPAKERELQPWERPLSPPRAVPKPSSTKKQRGRPSKETIEE